MKRFIIFLLILSTVAFPVAADTINWVDFDVSYEAMKAALDTDITTFDQEKHISWIDILALAACRTGGKVTLTATKKAAQDLKGEKSAEELLGSLYKYYDYYHEA